MKYALLIVLSVSFSLSIWASDSDHNHCRSLGGDFYDFQRAGDRDSHRQEWSNISWQQSCKTYYRIKTHDKKGALLVADGLTKVLGYGKFEIIKSGETLITVTCPYCPTKHYPTSCAFTSCYFTISGTKKNRCRIFFPWEKVEDWLWVFDSQSNLAEWKELTFECRSLYDPPPEDDF